MSRWRAAFAVYGDRRILSIFAFGFSSGLPLLLTKSGSTLGAWLTDSQVDLRAITMLAWAGMPYSLKFLWAPFLDRLSPPPGFARLGQRRGWMLFIQMVLAASILLLAATPADDTWMMGLAVLLVAFCSASQDVVVDAYRVDVLTAGQQAPGATMVQAGYRIAMLAAGAGALTLAEHVMPWPQVYMVMAALTTIGMAATLLNPEPHGGERKPIPPGAAAWIKDAVVSPFADMLRRQGAALFAILAFIILFKLCDAIPGSVATPFYKAMGFTNDEIAGISKVFGLGATLIGLALGGAVAVRFGLFRALFITGILQALSNLMYVWQSFIGHDRLALIATIAIENISGSMAAAVFVAYISRLCSLNYSATQYALLSALAALGTNFFSGFSGMLVQWLGWPWFFAFTTLTALPGMALLVWMMYRLPMENETPQA